MKRLLDAVYRIQDTRPKRKRSRIVVHFDRLKPCTSNPEPESDSEPTRRRESKDTTTIPQAHGVNLNVDTDDDEDADPAGCQGDPDNPGDVIIEQNEELLEQGDNLAVQEPSPSLPMVERRYPARERHPPEHFGT